MNAILKPVDSLIPLKDMSGISLIKSLFESHVNKAELEAYRLPITDNQTRVIVGMSGGADSSVLGLFVAVYLTPIYPNISFVFTDTLNEPESCYETLNKVEKMVGVTIERIVPELGLFGLIDKYNGFLPGSKARYCTTSLKIKPLVKYMNQFDNTAFINLAGIRFDEADRDGIAFGFEMEHSNEAKSAFPFIDLKITKDAVFDILNKSIGIPSTYAFRTRSGCSSCFMQRNAELIGLLLNDPVAFDKSASYEKLCDEDKDRWVTSYLPRKSYFPIPDFVDVRKEDKVPEKAPLKIKIKNDSETDDMFGEVASSKMPVSIFVAYALYTKDLLGMFGKGMFTPGVYQQEFITLSKSMAGLKSSLNMYYQFKKTTPMPQYDVKDMQVVIAQIDFSADEIDLAPPHPDSFTWKSKVSYSQLKYLVGRCHSVLEYSDISRQIADAEALLETDLCMDDYLDVEDQLERLEGQFERLTKPKGDIAWEGLFIAKDDNQKNVQIELTGISKSSKPKIAREGLDFDEVGRICIACSI